MDQLNVHTRQHTPSIDTAVENVKMLPSTQLRSDPCAVLVARDYITPKLYTLSSELKFPCKYLTLFCIKLVT